MNHYTILPRVPLVSDRHMHVVEHCRGKKVLHLGCVDAGLLNERFQAEELLHQKLLGAASELWGADIDAQGIAFLRDHGFDNLVVADVCDSKSMEQFRGQQFDVILACEIVEHLLNPGLFFDGVKTLMVPGKTELIVSVPNAFRPGTFLSMLRGVEWVHPDHNYWFSYVTIRNLLTKCGLTIDDVTVYAFQPPPVIRSRIRRLFGKRSEGGGGAGGNPGVAAATARKSLPRRLIDFAGYALSTWFASFLYSRTAFWGEGIILMTRIDPGSAVAAQPEAGVEVSRHGTDTAEPLK